MAKLIAISHEDFIDVGRHFIKEGLEPELLDGNSLCISQWVLDGDVLARAIYMNMDPEIKNALVKSGEYSKIKGQKVRVRYEVAEDLWHSTFLKSSEEKIGAKV